MEHVRANYPPRQPFEVRESDSALRNFARVYTVDGMVGYDITSVLRNNRRTKVKLILKCYMEKTSILGEIVIQPFAFHSNIEVNLDGTDEEELYITMT